MSLTAKPAAFSFFRGIHDALSYSNLVVQVQPFFVVVRFHVLASGLRVGGCLVVQFVELVDLYVAVLEVGGDAKLSPHTG